MNASLAFVINLLMARTRAILSAMATRDSSISEFWRDEAGIDQPPPPPTPPQGVATTPLNDAARLTWTPSPGARFYNIYWGPSSGVTPITGIKIESVQSPYLQVALTNGQHYYYVVTAVGLGGESLPSAQVSVVPSATAVPAQPTGVSASPGDGQVTINWGLTQSASAYNIYWSLSPGVTPQNGTLIGNISVPPYVQQGLGNGQTVYYVVTAINTNGESTPSAQVMVVVGTPVAGKRKESTITDFWRQNAEALLPPPGPLPVPLVLPQAAISIPLAVAQTGSIGIITNRYALPDHVHAHGLQPAGGLQHALVTQTQPGFLPAFGNVGALDVLGVVAGNPTWFQLISLDQQNALAGSNGTPSASNPYVTTSDPRFLADVVGPSVAVDSNLAAFSGTTGKLVKDAGIAVANVATLSGTQTIAGTKTFSAAPAFSAGASFGGQRLTAVADPTAATDAANREYVLAQIAAAIATIPAYTAGTGLTLSGTTFALATGAAVANIGYTPAHAGSNADITSLAGLTTPLSIAQGGTGSAAKAFVDLTTAQSVAGIKTFTSPPVMSGASITPGTIALAALAAGVVDLTSAQTIAGNKTWTNAAVFNGSVLFTGTATTVLGNNTIFNGQNNLVFGFTDNNAVALKISSNVIHMTFDNINNKTIFNAPTEFDQTLTMAAGIINMTGGSQGINWGHTSYFTLAVNDAQAFNIATGFGDNILGFDTSTQGAPVMRLASIATFDANSTAIINVKDPTSAQQAATKHYVDAAVGAVPVYTAGTGLTLTGSQFKLTTPVAVANGGTGSITQNFVDLTTAQTIAGIKTFSSAPVMSGASITAASILSSALANAAVATLSGTNSGDITLSNVGVAPNAKGATLSGQALTLQPFSTAFPGLVPAPSTASNRFLRDDGTWATAGSAYSAGTGLMLSGTTFSLTTPVSVANGGTGSTSQNFVDLSTAQTIAGLKTLTNDLTLTNADLTVSNGHLNLTNTTLMGVTSAGTWWTCQGGPYGTFTMNGANGAALNFVTAPGLDTIVFPQAATFNNAPTMAGLTLSASSVFNAGANVLTNVADPTSAQHAATRNYVDTQVTATATRVILPKTAGYTLLAADGNKVLTNTGSTGTVIFTLPAATLGLTYSFSVEVAQILEILAVGTDVLRIGATTSAAAGNLQSNVIGSTLVLVCTKAGTWTTMGGISGTWTVN